jgi:crossover junction endodeoxyribonuclease RuvC
LKILGIDPGLRHTGFALIDKAAVGNQLKYITCGTIHSGEGEVPERLRVILKSLIELIEEFAPEQVAVEKVFVNVNPQSTLLLGQARGAAIAAAVLHDLPVYEYTALQVKQAVVGHGKAAKEQVQDMVQRLLKLKAAPRSDAADALACAICHAHASQLGGESTYGLRMRGGRLVGSETAVKSMIEKKRKANA